MKTIIAGKDKIKEAAKLIKNGEVVVFPTETVYGLGANALDERAVEKIFIAKGRPQDNPLIVHIESVEQASIVAFDIPDAAYLLWEKFSPGPLTIVLRKQPNIPYITTAGLETVGIRIPNNEIALMLIKEAGLPIAAPSANISGRVSPTEARFVYDDLKGKVPIILDGGPCEVGIESTVLDLTKDIPTILRPGAITEKMLAEVLHYVVNHKGEIIKASSPGMKYTHYKPKSDCVAVKTPKQAIEIYDRRPLESLIVGRESFVSSCGNRKKISLGSTPKECMQNYFRVLRENENLYKFMIIENLEGLPEYVALQNRIEKAVSVNDLHNKIG